MGKVEALLARMADQRVYLDSNVFVYFLDRNPEYFPVVAPIMQGVESGRILGCARDAAFLSPTIPTSGQLTPSRSSPSARSSRRALRVFCSAAMIDKAGSRVPYSSINRPVAYC